jgi:Flp pilus assembly protein TadG
MTDERGSVAITVVVLLPFLLAIVSGVVEIGALRVLAARISTAADLATLSATDDQDTAALVDTGALRLAPDAAQVARDFFARNLAAVAPHLAVTPEAAAAAADVATFATPPVLDPVTGWHYDRPTVRIAASVPVRAPAFGLFLVPATTAISVRAASSPR